MKKWRKLVLYMALSLCLTACAATSPPAQPGNEEENSGVAQANDFKMKLFSDKKVYKTTEDIKLWATLVYQGQEETVTIWHGLPYLTFNITDGKDFNLQGVIQTILTSTTLHQGEVYRTDYVKSGGWSADAPDAAFWEEFFREEAL